MLINVLGTDEKVLSFFSNMLKILISTARFAHIKGILAFIGHPGWIVLVVVHDAPEDRVPAEVNKSQTT